MSFTTLDDVTLCVSGMLKKQVRRLIMKAIALFLLATFVLQPLVAAEGGEESGPIEGQMTNRGLFMEPLNGKDELSGDSKDNVVPTLRFWFEKEEGEGDTRSRGLFMGEDDFTTGDRVWLRFESNVDGYAYVANRGTSGNVSLLFPGVSGSDNRLKAHETMTIPTVNQPFELSPPAGIEELVVVLSPTPITELELIAEKSRRTRSLYVMSSDDESLWKDAVIDDRITDLSGEGARARGLMMDEGDGVYASDRDSSGGFHRPVLIRRELRHR